MARAEVRADVRRKVQEITEGTEEMKSLLAENLGRARGGPEGLDETPHPSPRGTRLLILFSHCHPGPHQWLLQCACPRRPPVFQGSALC